MELCNPLTNVNDLRLMVRTQYALPKKITAQMNRKKVCNAFQKCSGDDLPLPPMRYQKVNPTTGVYYPRDTSFSGRDFYSLFSNPKLKELQRLARKIGVFQKDATKSMLFMSITEFLKASGVPEPIQVRLSPNKVVRNANNNNTNNTNNNNTNNTNNNANNNNTNNNNTNTNTNNNATRRNTNNNNTNNTTNATRRNTTNATRRNTNNATRRNTTNATRRNTTNATRRNTTNATRRNNTNATRRNTNQRPIPTRVGPPVGGPGPRRTMYMPPPQRRIPPPPNATSRLRTYEEFVRNVRYKNESSIKSWAASRGFSVGNYRNKNELVNQLIRRQWEKLNVEDRRTLAKSLGMTNVSTYEYKKKLPTMNSRPPPPKGPSNNNKKGPPPPQIVEVTKAINSKNVKKLKELENSTNSNVAKAANEARVAVETGNNTRLRRVTEETNKTALRNLRMYATRKGVKNANKYETVKTLEMAIRNAEARAPVGNAPLAKLEKEKAELNAKLEAKKAEANAARRAKNAAAAAKIEKEKAELNAKLAQAKATKNAELAAKLERQKAELERRKNSGFTYDLPNIQVPKFKRAPPEVRAAKREKLKRLFGRKKTEPEGAPTKNKVTRVFNAVYKNKQGDPNDAETFKNEIRKLGNKLSKNTIEATFKKVYAFNRNSLNQNLKKKRDDFTRLMLNEKKEVPQAPEAPKNDSVSRIFKRVYPTNDDRGNANLAKEFLNKIRETRPNTPNKVEAVFTNVYGNRSEITNKNIINKRNRFARELLGIKKEVNAISPELVKGYKRAFDRDPEPDLIKAIKESDRMPDTIKQIFNKFEGNSNTLTNKERNLNKENRLRERFIKEIKQPESEFKIDNIQYNNNNRPSIEKQVQALIAEKHGVKPINIEIEDIKSGSITVIYYIVGIPYNPNRKSLNSVKNINKIEYLTNGTSIIAEANKYKNKPDIANYIKKAEKAENASEKITALKQLNKLLSGTKTSKAREQFKTVSKEYNNLIKRFSNKVEVARKLKMNVKNYDNAIASRNPNKIKEQNAKIDGDIREYLQKIAKELKVTHRTTYNSKGNEILKTNMKLGGKLNNLNANLLNKYKKIPEIKNYLNSSGNKQPVPQEKINSLLNKQKYIAQADEIIKQLQMKPSGINNARRAINNAKNSVEARVKFAAFSDIIIKELKNEVGSTSNTPQSIAVAATKARPTPELLKRLNDLKLVIGDRNQSGEINSAINKVTKRIPIYEKLLKELKLNRTTDWKNIKSAAKKNSHIPLIKKLLIELNIKRTPENQEEIDEFFANNGNYSKLKSNNSFANLFNASKQHRFLTSNNRELAATLLKNLENKEKALLEKSQAKNKNVAKKLKELTLMTAFPDATVFYTKENSRKKYGKEYEEIMNKYMKIPKTNRKADFTNEEVSTITKTHGYLSPIIEYLKNHKTLYDLIVNSDDKEAGAVVSNFTETYKQALGGKLGPKKLGRAHTEANKRFNVARTISAALKFIGENNLQPSNLEPSRKNRYNTLMKKYDERNITLKELNELWGAMSVLYNIKLTTGSKNNNGNKKIEKMFNKDSGFSKINEGPPTSAPKSTLPARAKAYQVNNEQAKAEQAKAVQRNATEKLKKITSQPVIVENPGSTNGIGVVMNSKNIKINVNKEQPQRLQKLKNAVKDQQFVESNKKNFTDSILVNASKSQASTENMLRRIENAKKRRRLFTRVFGTGNKRIASFNITKMPNLKKYEKSIKDIKYETEQAQVKGEKLLSNLKPNITPLTNFGIINKNRNSNINIEEFKNFVKSRIDDAKDDEIEAAFKIIDKNNDNNIKYVELQSFFGITKKPRRLQPLLKLQDGVN